MGPPTWITLTTLGSLVWSLVTNAWQDVGLTLEAEHPVVIYTC